MIPGNGQPLEPRRVYLTNVIFWQCAGYLIGGLMPGAALAPIFRYGLPRNPSEQDIYWWFWTAGLTSPVTALIGGIVGSIVGFRDKTLPWRRPKPPSRRDRSAIEQGAT